jgi:hypothetical protein
MAHISNLITLEWSWGVAAPAVGYDIDEKLGGEDCDQLRIRGLLLTRPAGRRLAASFRHSWTHQPLIKIIILFNTDDKVVCVALSLFDRVFF